MKCFASPFDFYYKLARYWDENGLSDKPHGKSLLYGALRDFCESLELGLPFLEDFLRFDLLINEDEKNIPEWMKPALSEEQKRRVREAKAAGEGRLEFFQTDIPAYLRGNGAMPSGAMPSGNIVPSDAMPNGATPVKKETAVLISYAKPGRQSPFKILERVREVEI